MMSSFIAKLKRALKDNSFPPDLQKILIDCGFDSESSIYGINSDVIKDTEAFLSEHKEILHNTSYETILRNENSKFKFKPGHKSVLLLLPKSLRDYNNSTKKKRTNKKEEDPEEDLSLDEQLKESLINKLVKFTAPRHFDVILDKSLIQDYRLESNQTKCRIRCPICQTPITCFHTTYWHASNFEKHIKKHFQIFEGPANSTVIEVEQVEQFEVITHNNNELNEVLSD